jgi:CBS domain-containing protein
MTDAPSIALGDQPIQRFMSAAPVCIASHRTLAEAWSTMQREHIRHLPVLDGGLIVGVISQRDLALLGGPRPERLQDVRIEDAMSGDPYLVEPEVPLRNVISGMRSQRVGSAVVVERGNVVGVFTTTDALALLHQALGGQPAQPSAT